MYNIYIYVHVDVCIYIHLHTHIYIYMQIFKLGASKFSRRPAMYGIQCLCSNASHDSRASLGQQLDRVIVGP